MTPFSVLLFATVGGSHQPVVTAIRQARPRRVVFFCTDRDPATHTPGSRTQVEGGGLCIRADAKDDKPTLPNIPTQCGLGAGDFEVRIVPADDLDGAYAAIRVAMREARERFPDARLVADYTGGTKTMTAALVLAALDHGADLQLVAGTRADLVRVRDGTQEAAPAQVEAVRLEREMAPLLAAWSRFAYDEAAAGLESIPVPANPRLRATRRRAVDLSRGFAAWDRFDHASALSLIDPYGGSLRPAIGARLDALKHLAGNSPEHHARREGLRIWDLWLNARRRAAAGRYDDAVARAYRMIEWTAQWILATRKGWRTAALPAEVAAAAGIAPSREGAYPAGLFQAWALVEAHAGGAAAEFFAGERGALLHHLGRRNTSILAHGFDPVGPAQWNEIEAWLRDAFEPMLRQEMTSLKARPFDQLPHEMPAIA